MKRHSSLALRAAIGLAATVACLSAGSMPAAAQTGNQQQNGQPASKGVNSYTQSGDRVYTQSGERIYSEKTNYVPQADPNAVYQERLTARVYKYRGAAADGP